MIIVNIIHNIYNISQLNFIYSYLSDKIYSSYRTSASRTRSNMDFVSLALRALKVDRVTEMNDTIREVRCRLREMSCDELRMINLAEVAWHDTLDDCWLVIYDYVYDCTEFLKSHPGGQDILVEYAGRDATLAFIGTGHSAVARATLERYKIGELPPKERLFRTPNGLKVSGI